MRRRREAKRNSYYSRSHRSIWLHKNSQIQKQKEENVNFNAKYHSFVDLNKIFILISIPKRWNGINFRAIRFEYKEVIFKIKKKKKNSKWFSIQFYNCVILFEMLKNGNLSFHRYVLTTRRGQNNNKTKHKMVLLSCVVYLLHAIFKSKNYQIDYYYLFGLLCSISKLVLGNKPYTFACTNIDFSI